MVLREGGGQRLRRSRRLLAQLAAKVQDSFTADAGFPAR